MSFFILATLLCSSVVSALPLARQNSCSSPATRVDWVTLSSSEKTAYFDAEVCLMRAPAQTNLADVVTRYDDLVTVHQLQGNTNDGTDKWHFVGQFLHVHRYYLHVHETLLRQECNYTGPIPYWNEEPDAGNYINSEVVSDFGGFGKSEDQGYVVEEGPFANLDLRLGPGNNNRQHQLARYFNQRQSRSSSSWYVSGVKRQTNFADFLSLIRDTLHLAGHNGVGGGWGDMSNVLSSPNDPLFFMHHAYLDKLWTEWQGDDESRINDLEDAGNETQSEPETGYVATNPGTVLSVYGILPDTTVGEVARTTGGYLCYTYE
ncbi:Di-copper centre-containing protein [Mucidula mucida]|nr:Di-copper centre-containing protein [Mucidula mucida]